MLELIAEFLLNVVLIGVFYWPGWLFLRVLTLGRYPPRGGGKHDPEFVAVFGVVLLVVILLLGLLVAGSALALWAFGEAMCATR